MKNFDEAVAHARGRLVEAQKIIDAFEPTHVNKRRPKNEKPTQPETPTKKPNGKAS